MDFTELYDIYADTVYSYIRFRIKDKYLAEDIFQDTFLSVYQKATELKKVRSVKAWLLKIAHNKMVDRLRKNKDELLSDHPAGKETSCMHGQDQLIDGIFINELLNQLDETSREIIYGIYAEQLSCKDMAEILGLPEGTVKSRSYYARARLREWLKEAKDND
ncbi:MAG TPA: sigma-70 family RNA polymerase sigma factor [Clostridiales bacterium]|nr:sigma-70 family RNA polymerase sigma factor [Clostridiales bacterium]